MKRSILLLTGLIISASLMAETPEEKGYAIAAKSDASDRGFESSEVELKMILRNKAGDESSRELTIETLEVLEEGHGEKSVVVFSSPRDIDGTALLSHAKTLDPDDQWLYLPALKRVKRISSKNKSGPFVGSEFAFEDFTALELGKFTYKWLDTGEAGGLACDIVERYPRYEHSGYSKQISWIDQTHHQVRKVEFYDRRGDLIKTLELLDYKQYAGGVWRAQKLSMTNAQTGKSTDMVYSEYQFKTGLSDADFVSTKLTRTR